MAEIPATMKEIIHAMPAYANADAIKNVDKTLQFSFNGEETGQYYLVVQNGSVTAHDGVAPKAEVTIETPSEV